MTSKTTTTTTAANGQPQRKTLASQLDRLDEILDVLAEGLNEAVADAVKDAVTLAVREAVQAAVAEVLTNPDVLDLIRASAAQAPPSAAPAAPAAEPAGRPGLFARAKAAVGAGLRRAGRAVADKARQAREAAGLLRRAAGSAWRHKGQLPAALGVGLLAGVAVYCAGPVVAGVLGGACGFLGTLAVKASRALRRALRRALLAPAAT